METGRTECTVLTITSSLLGQVTGRRPVDRPEELINRELKEMYLREVEHKKIIMDSMKVNIQSIM